jgi:transcriptional antiterminator RfaH
MMLYCPGKPEKNWPHLADSVFLGVENFRFLQLHFDNITDKLFFSVSGICIAQTDTGGKRMIDTQRNWYVVYSKPRKEEQVQLHLGIKGIESFFPRLQLPGSVKRNTRIAPLFPNYLFVRVNLTTESHYVIWSPGVKRIVSFGDTPIPLEDSVVQFLREKASAQGVIQAHSQLRPGQQVEISGGPFDGFTGIIENPPNGKGRVKILLKLLSRQISVKLGVEFVRNQPVGIVVPTLTNNHRPDVLSAAG